VRTYPLRRLCSVGDDAQHLATNRATNQRMKNQYAAKARRVFVSVARMRVSVLKRLPARVGSMRNSIPTLIHPGPVQARNRDASSRGGGDPPSRRQAWLRPAEITTWGRSANRIGMGVTSRKVRGPKGECFRPAS
jgi:hypothetical protein